MRVHHLKIEGFRGIRSLEWQLHGRMSCLVGPGDSTKTTILDAIEYALTPRWSLPLTDVDFHGGRCSQPIAIHVSVGDLPPSLMSDDKFGLELRGWKPGGGIRDEPEEGDEPLLTIRLLIDDSLEPSWLVVNGRRPEGRPISSRDREALGMVRLGGEVDRHLAWGRGSALSRATEDFDGVGAVLAEAQREARAMVDKASLTKLEAAATKAKAKAAELGVRALQPYRPALDAGISLVSAGILSLHEGGVPLRAAGLATRRLAALALQTIALEEGAILLVDELEHGLEPHRLRHLVRILRASPDAGRGQVFATTHSPVAVTELTVNDLCIVRCVAGVTSVTKVPVSLQALVRASAETFLGHKALVCEGKTEMGVCRGLEATWAAAHGGLPLSQTGAVLTNGEGSKTSQVACSLAALGYPTAVLGDSDDPAGPNVTELEAQGVQTVILWAGGLAIEQRIAADLPWDGIQALVDLGVRSRGPQAVLDVQVELADAMIDGAMIGHWQAGGVTESQIRIAVGVAAKKCKWFKRTDLGQQLGQTIARFLPEVEQTDLARKLKAVETWAYGD